MFKKDAQYPSTAEWELLLTGKSPELQKEWAEKKKKLQESEKVQEEEQKTEEPRKMWGLAGMVEEQDTCVYLKVQEEEQKTEEPKNDKPSDPTLTIDDPSKKVAEPKPT